MVICISILHKAAVPREKETTLKRFMNFMKCLNKTWNKYSLVFSDSYV